MSREPLPERRRSETLTLRHDGLEVAVTVGFYDDGRPGEAFADTMRSGAALQHLLADACVVISIALQHGVPPGDLLKSLGRVPDLDRGKGHTRPASALGAILETVAEARLEPLPAAARASIEGRTT